MVWCASDKIRRKTLFSIILFSLFLLAVPNVLAHSSPIVYYPEPNSVLSEFPHKISISFSERVEQEASSIEVIGPSGKVNVGEEYVDPANRRLFNRNIDAKEQGTYTVKWHIVSADDGHFSQGEYQFSINQNHIASFASVQIQHLTTIPEAIVITIELLGISILLGILIFFFAWFIPFEKKVFPLEFSIRDSHHQRRFSSIVVFGVLLVVIGTLSFILLKTLDLQQLKGTGFFETLLIFSETNAGKHAIFRAAIATVFLGIFYRKKQLFTQDKVMRSEMFLLSLITILVLSRSIVSHAAASDFLPSISILMMFLHLTAKLAWVGGLIALVFVFFPLMSKLKQSKINVTASLRASKLLTILFIVTGTSGIYIAGLHLKNFSNLFSMEWGSSFLILLFIGSIFLILRLRHQLIFEPSLVKPNKKRHKFSSFLVLEMFVGIMLIFSSSMMSITTPPYLIESFGYEKTSTKDGKRITLAAHPLDTDRMLVEVQPSNDVYDVEVELTNSKTIYPNVVRRSGSKFIFDKAEFSEGEWNVKVIVKGDDENAANFVLNYPSDVRPTENERSFGKFGVLMVILSLLVVLIGVRLLAKNKELTERSSSKKEIVQSASPELDWSKAVLGFFVILIATIAFSTFIVKSDFQKECESRGQFWIQSTPFYNGKVLSPNTVTGCTLDIGLYHFSDHEEYKFFLRETESEAEMIVQDEIVAGEETELKFKITEREISPVYRFESMEYRNPEDMTIEHERILHVLIISEDLSVIGHVHPEDLGEVTEEMIQNGELSTKFHFPKAGTYTLFIDYVLRGQLFEKQFFVEVQGQNKMPTMNFKVPDKFFRQTKTFEGYRVKFSAPREIKSGEPVNLLYQIYKDGKPIDNLQPYLGATMHVSTVKTNLRDFKHTHGQIYFPGTQSFEKLFNNYVSYHSHFVPERFGPEIEVPITFQKQGDYKIFGEIKHNGKVILTEFFVEVK